VGEAGRGVSVALVAGGTEARHEIELALVEHAEQAPVQRFVAHHGGQAGAHVQRGRVGLG
jgi:hypothetical protein